MLKFGMGYLYIYNIKSRYSKVKNFRTSKLSHTLQVVLMSTNMSVARTLAYEIPNFWTNLSGLIHSSNLGMIEANITRVYCIQGALRFHKWLLYVVSAAVERESNSTWINKLACDVRNAIQAGTRMTFQSIDYLPRLDISREYTVPAMPFQFDPKDIVTSTMTSILRFWLYFPSDESTLVQLSLIDIVITKSPSSIFFLDAIWEMYKTPFVTVFNNRWDIRSSKTKLEKSLALFQKQFDDHPFANPGTLAYRKLEYLEQLIHRWINNDRTSVEQIDNVSFDTLQGYLVFYH
jgi:hypothetical protein